MVHKLMLWTNDPEKAAWADRAGVDRIGLDLERIGKHDRQSGRGTWLSPHCLEDMDRIRPEVTRAEIFVRTNPLHEGSMDEIDAIVDRGATVLVLPNFKALNEIVEFMTIVAGRAHVVPLVERFDAVDLVGLLPKVGIEEIHVGLNDLSIDLGLRNCVSVLTSPVMDRIMASAREAGLRVGIGGLSRAHDEALTVPSDLVYAEHARRGGSGALIARSFWSEGMSEAVFAREINRLRSRLAEWGDASPQVMTAAHERLERLVSAIETSRLSEPVSGREAAPGRL